MTQILIRLAASAACAASLAACATVAPSYPTHEGYVAQGSEPAKPQYPVRESEGPSAPASETGLIAVSTLPSTAPVQSTSLAPIAAPAGDSGRNAAADAPTPSTPQHASAPEHPSAPEHIGASPAPDAVADRPAPPPTRAQSAAQAQREAQSGTPKPAGPTTLVSGRVVAAGGVFMDYEVSKGDHVDALAREFATTRKAIVDANHLKAPYNMRPGQMIKIPVNKAYVVEAGDTLNLVARRFGVEVAELTELNHISTRKGLSPGQKLALPATFHDRGPIRVASEGEAPVRHAVPQPVPSQHYVPTPQPNNPGLTAQTPTYGNPNIPRPAQGRPQTMVDSTPALSDAQISDAARGRFVWPIHGDILSGYGPKGVGRRNDGLDIKAAQGTVVHAAAAGDVVYAGDQVPGFGNLVLVKHADGWVTDYAHLDKVAVQMRQQVMQGQEIGQVGLSGGVTEPQLHFEVRYAPTPTDKAKPVDPALVLPR